jgi:hypothetical protein
MSQPCAKCGKSFDTNNRVGLALSIEALGQVFHPGCFCCAQCGVSIATPVEFYEIAQKPYCLTCGEEYAKLECKMCEKVIVNGVGGIKAYGFYWHNNCFLCGKCQKPLGTEGFYNDEASSKTMQLLHLACQK